MPRARWGGSTVGRAEPRTALAAPPARARRAAGNAAARPRWSARRLRRDGRDRCRPARRSRTVLSPDPAQRVADLAKGHVGLDAGKDPREQVLVTAGRVREAGEGRVGG